MKRCLWVVPKGIFPVRDGARVANQALLKSVRPHFNELDIMLFNEEDSDELHLAITTKNSIQRMFIFSKKLQHQESWKNFFS